MLWDESENNLILGEPQLDLVLELHLILRANCMFIAIILTQIFIFLRKLRLMQLLLCKPNTQGSAREARIGYDYSASVLKLVNGTSFAGSTNGINIDTDGKVGIANASPSYLLDVNPTAKGGAIARFTSDTTNSAADVLIVDQDNSDTRAALQVQGLGGSNECLFVASSGKIGIGSTSPGHTLDVSGEFRVNGGGTGTIVVNDEDSSLCPTMTFLRNGGGTTTNDFIKFENSGGEVAAINASGGGYFSSSVGIGNSSPSKALVVNENDSECVIVVTSSRFGNCWYLFWGSIRRGYWWSCF